MKDCVIFHGWCEGQFDGPLWLFKKVSSKEREKPWLLVTLNINMSHIFPKHFIEIPKVI